MEYYTVDLYSFYDSVISFLCLQMAPRHVPRGLRNLDTDGERRSRYNSYLREALEMDPDMSYVEGENLMTLQ